MIHIATRRSPRRRHQRPPVAPGAVFPITGPAYLIFGIVDAAHRSSIRINPDSCCPLLRRKILLFSYGRKLARRATQMQPSGQRPLDDVAQVRDGAQLIRTSGLPGAGPFALSNARTSAAPSPAGGELGFFMSTDPRYPQAGLAARPCEKKPVGSRRKGADQGTPRLDC